MKKALFTLALILTLSFAAGRFFINAPSVSENTPQPVVKQLTENFPMPEEVTSAPQQHRIPAEAPKAEEPMKKEEIPAIAEKSAEPVVHAAQEKESVALASKPVESAELAEPLEEEEAEDEVTAPTDNSSEEPEFLFRPYVGYGAKYVKLAQSGAFGAGDGGVDLASGPAFGAELEYGKWSVAAAFEKMSVKFPIDSTGVASGEYKDFKKLSLKGSYDIFFLGVKARTAPLARAGTAALTWADVTTVEATGGVKFEKVYAGKRKRPFLVGGEVEGSLPLYASANGGPSLSKSSGFGVSLRGYAEKAVSSGKTYQLKLGLDASASYDQLKVDGTWSGASGTATRTIQEYGSKFYVGLEF